MAYQVKCECGKSHDVTTGDAGSSLQCDCGRRIEVPALHELRHEAGQTTLSADVQIRTMLLNRLLPEETDCVSCHRSTDHSIRVLVECEQAVVKADDGGMNPVGCFLLGLLFGWIVLVRKRPYRVYGEGIFFNVPLRVCEYCDAEISSQADLLAAVRKVPLYRSLLDKYPNAILSRGH